MMGEWTEATSVPCSFCGKTIHADDEAWSLSVLYPEGHEHEGELAEVFYMCSEACHEGQLKTMPLREIEALED
jgi:hypothetical protein